MANLKGISYAIYLVGFAMLFSYLGNESYIDKVVQDQIYEENVCRWQYEASKRIPEHLRSGHPNYKYREVRCNVYDKVYQESNGSSQRVNTRNTTALHKSSANA